VASFKIRAHAGVNRIRFKGRVHGRKLGPGVYRLRGRAGAKTVLRKTLVVGNGIVFTCSGANPLRTIVTFFSGGSDGSGAFGSTSLAGGTGKSGHESGSAISSKVTKKPNAPAPKRAGLLGARASKVLPGDGGTQLALLLILGAAIVLLALGAVPREAVPHRAAAAFIAERRALIAGGGLAALGAFLISYLIT
jgi:hypothetical protein